MAYQNNGLLGSWLLTINPAQGSAERSLGTFAADGTMTASPQPALTSPVAPGAVIFTSGGHGAWEAVGPGEAILTFVVLIGDEQGNLFGTNTIRAAVALGADGQTFSGNFVWTIADRGGATMATVPGTANATRIVAEAPRA